MKARKTAAVLLSTVLLAGCNGGGPANTVQTTEFVTTVEETTTSETTTTTTTTTTATDPVPEPVDTMADVEDTDGTDVSEGTEADTTTEGFSGETADDTTAAVITDAPVTTTDIVTAASTADTTRAPVMTTTSAAPAVTTTTTAPAAATTTAPKITVVTRSTTAAPEVTTTAATTTTTAISDTDAPPVEYSPTALSASGWRNAYSDSINRIFGEVDDALDDASSGTYSGEYAESVQGFRKAASLLDAINGSYYTIDPGVPPEFSVLHAEAVSVARELKAAAEEAANAMSALASAAAGLEVYFGSGSPIDDIVDNITETAADIDTEDEGYQQAVDSYTETVDDLVSGLEEIETSLPDSSGEVQSVLGEWQNALNRLRGYNPPSGFESLHSGLCQKLERIVSALTEFRDAVSRYYVGYALSADELRERFKDACDAIDAETRG